MKNIPSSTVLIVIGLIIVLLSPFTPDFIFYVVNNYDITKPLYDVNFSNIRTANIIPSVRMTGILITVYGFILIRKER